MWDYREGELQSAKIGKFQTAEMPARERSGDKGGIGTFSYDLMLEMMGHFLFSLLKSLAFPKYFKGVYYVKIVW